MIQKILLASGNLFFRVRDALFPVIFIGLFLFTRPTLFFGNEFLDRFVVTLGVITALAGQCFRLSVIGFAYIKRGGKEGRVYADDLVIEGFYAHTRNPMYVANYLITVGLGLMYGSPWVYFFVIPFFSYVYLAIVTAEEIFLRSKFGPDYDEYCRKVNRFVPNFRGLKNSLKKFTYDWKKVIRKEYGTLFGTLFALVFIPLWKAWYIYGFTAKKGEIIVRILLLVLGVLGYLWVRKLKKSGKLHTEDASAGKPS